MVLVTMVSIRGTKIGSLRFVEGSSLLFLSIINAAAGRFVGGGRGAGRGNHLLPLGLRSGRFNNTQRTSPPP